MSSIEKSYEQARSLLPRRQVPTQELELVLLWRTVPSPALWLVHHDEDADIFPGFWALAVGNGQELGAEPQGSWRVAQFPPSDIRARVVAVHAGAGEDGPGDGEWVELRALVGGLESAGHWLISPLHELVRALSVAPVLSAEIVAAALSASSEESDLWQLSPTLRVLPMETPTLPPATHTNTVLLGSEELLWIDPSSPSDEEQQRCFDLLEREARAGRSLGRILLTHHHGDHHGAAQAAARRFGVPIAAHRETARLLEGRLEVDELVEDGEILQLMGPVPCELECLWTPGHAPGHLCLRDLRTGVVVAGDMVAGEGTILIDPDDGDMAAYLRSLQRLLDSEARALVPAHGKVLTNPASTLEHYLQHRGAREQKVVAALETSGQDLARLVSRVYSDTPVFLHGLAERSLLAHLHKLRDEGRAVLGDEGWKRTQ